jgi:transposase
VISVEDWALIRRLVADGVPQRQVARDLGIGRSTVERALASDRPPKYERPAVPTSFTPFEPLVRQLLATTPEMPATVIAERVGWTGSITWFRENVRRQRPEHRPVDPADRLTWLLVMRRSVICGSRPRGSRSRTPPRRCCRCW